MDKRGQVTVFVMVGLLILVSFGTLYYIVRISTIPESEAAPPELAPIKHFVENCLEKSIVDGIYHTLARGGYNVPPVDGRLFEFTERDQLLQIPYYFQNNEPHLPPLEVMEVETASAATGYFLGCIDDFRALRGYTVRAGDPSLSIHFSDKTSAVLDYPVTVISGDKESAFRSFVVDIPFNFREKYTGVESFLQRQAGEPDYFLVGDLSQLAAEEGYGLGFEQRGEEAETVLIGFQYDENLKEEPVLYRFALSYDWSTLAQQREEVSVAEPRLLLQFLAPWNITEPGIATYQVEAIGDGLTYSLDPDSLSISERGLITLNTAEFTNDEYLYYVVVQDRWENEIAAPLLINVNVNPGKMPVIRPISSAIVLAGQVFYYNVNVDGENGSTFLFTDDSPLFDIDKRTGEISFVPSPVDEGIHSVRIDVENEFGRTWQRWELEVR